MSAYRRKRLLKKKKIPLLAWLVCVAICVIAVFAFYSSDPGGSVNTEDPSATPTASAQAEAETNGEEEIIPHEAEAAEADEQESTAGATGEVAQEADADAETELSALPEPICGVIEPGDTAANLLKEWLNPAEIHALAAVCKPVHPLERLKAGQPYVIEPAENGQGLNRFEYEIDNARKLVISPCEGGYAPELQNIVYDVEFARLEGEIKSSLFQTVSDLGENANLAIALADIFAWEIDFIRDLRVGDSFTLLVEKRYRDGEFKGYGPILAATFVNQGQARAAYLFVDAVGSHHYFAEDGSSMRRSFLKAPLSFTRISSGFSYNRKHPIFNDVRKHEGIDYAAPTGTPVKSVGSGTVQFAATQGGYGKLIIVRHANGYETYYAHLSKYAQGVQKGAKVRQGEVIGYVGMTGWATGPHLDFRIKKDGTFVNPGKMINPRTDPVEKALRPLYDRRVAVLAGMLGNAGADLLALAELEPLPAL